MGQPTYGRYSGNELRFFILLGSGKLNHSYAGLLLFTATTMSSNPGEEMCTPNVSLNP